MLNVNQLANALKPVVLPGETMRVFILREGKEYNQGVAYLDDGTMVVVDGARRVINKTVDITVTSVHQTTAGKDDFRPLRRPPRNGAPCFRGRRGGVRSRIRGLGEAQSAADRMPRSIVPDPTHS